MKVNISAKSQAQLRLLNNKEYDCLGVEGGWYRVIDETGEDYLYPPEVIKIKDMREYHVEIDKHSKK